MFLPNYLVEENAVRESGETPAIALGEHSDQNLLITLGITHAMEQESLDVDILTSNDGRSWSAEPVISFPRKFYCGTYQMMLPAASGRFLKAVWKVTRWDRKDDPPFFRFYLSAQSGRVHAMAGAA